MVEHSGQINIRIVWLNAKKFQRSMENILLDMGDEFAFPHLDETLVFSYTFDDFLNHFGKVFERLREKAIKIKASKCKFFQRQLSREGF